MINNIIYLIKGQKESLVFNSAKLVYLIVRKILS